MGNFLLHSHLSWFEAAGNKLPTWDNVWWNTGCVEIGTSLDVVIM